MELNGLEQRPQQKDAGLMALNWVKGRVLFEGVSSEVIKKVEPAIKLYFSGILDLDPYVTRLDLKASGQITINGKTLDGKPKATGRAFLDSLKLPSLIVYLSPTKATLINQLPTFEQQLKAAAPSVRQQLEPSVVELRRLKAIRDASEGFNAVTFGLIRGLTLSNGVFTVRYAPTDTECPHSGALGKAVGEALGELVNTLNSSGSGLPRISRFEHKIVPGQVWKPEDLDQSLTRSMGQLVGARA